MKENYASRRAAEAVADARDMSAADFATPQDRRTRRCAWGGESEGWKGGGGGRGVQGTRGRCRDTGSIRRIHARIH
jgi:hypothetical protein